MHPLEFLYESESYVMTKPTFSYYKYMGSNTQPPCAEYVLWLVVDEKLKVSSTVLAMLRDSIDDP